ncbi:limonene-1,2-epoxide hydrolase family protein, partial [Rhodococcus gannanensis]
MTPTSPDTTTSAAVVEEFLTALAHADLDAATALTTEDIVWQNVSLPTLRGARAVGVMRGLARPSIKFDVIMHNITATGNVVQTERTDLIAVGPLSVEFWVCGTFEVRDGRIAVWRDYFSYRDSLRGLIV